MDRNTRAWDFLSEDQRRAAVNEIIGYFLDERNETIGIVAAGHILDFFLQTCGSAVYNKAIDDIKPFLTKELESTLLNLDISLRKKVDLKQKKQS